VSMIVKIFDEEGTKIDSWFLDYVVPAIGDTVEVGYVAKVIERHWLVGDDIIVQLKVREIGH